MQLILAIDSDPRRSEQLANLVRARLQVDLVQATSAGEGLHALRDRVPDLILTSPLLSPFDDGVLDEYLRDLGAAATHVQTVRIPMLSSGPKKKSAATRLFSLGRKKPQTSSASPDGCDPKVFADEIAHYLTRSLEERSSVARATEDRAASTTTTGQTAPARVSQSWREPFEQLVEEWTAPDAMVQEFNEATHTGWSNGARATAAPEPVVEDTYIPGSILDLRTPIAHHAPQRVVAAEPEPQTYAFIEPDPIVEPEPVMHEIVELEPLVELKPLVEPESFVKPEPFTSIPVDVARHEPRSFDAVQRESVFLRPQTLDDQVRPVVRVEPAPTVIAPRVTPPAVTAPPAVATPVVASRATAPPASAPPAKARPAAPLAQTAPASGSSASGNSASFEAALAAIRAAWAKPESAPATPAAAPASPVAVKPLAGSGEVDLTNQVDALEDVTAVDGSSPGTDGDALHDANPSKGRRKTDKPVKRPEKPRARRTSGADDRDGHADGRSDWGVFDSSQYELSALVNKLDEVTDSDKVTPRATNRR